MRYHKIRKTMVLLPLRQIAVLIRWMCWHLWLHSSTTKKEKVQGLAYCVYLQGHSSLHPTDAILMACMLVAQNLHMQGNLPHSLQCRKYLVQQPLLSGLRRFFYSDNQAASMSDSKESRLVSPSKAGRQHVVYWGASWRWAPSPLAVSASGHRHSIAQLKS